MCAAPSSHTAAPTGESRSHDRAAGSPVLPCMLDRAESLRAAIAIHRPHSALSLAPHRITAVQRDKKQTTKINFKDADGKTTSKLFRFEHVVKTFKPLT